jgi:methyltransferase (TIGR00027 family)
MPARRPSLTARRTAAHRLRLERTRASTPGGDVRGERALYRDVRGRGVFALPLGRAAGVTERTSFVDNEVAGAIGHGMEQVVLVGAGYDGRALRFAGAARWFEVDHAATVEDKQHRLRALGVEASPVEYLGIDLAADDLDTALEAAGHRADAPSLFVCEDLFASLALETIASLCEALRARAADGSVLVSTFFVMPDPAGATASAALRTAADLLLRVAGEPRRGEFRPGDPEKLMVVTGWRAARSQRIDAGRLHPGAHLLALAATPAPPADTSA